MLPLLVAILGPTASGKSELALGLAERLGGEIVNCDSVQIYRGLSVGAGKMPASQQRGIPHHLYDLAQPGQSFSAGQYMQVGRQQLEAIAGRGKTAVIVGGTGLYFRALTRGLFEGPSRDESVRRRLRGIADRKGDEFLSRWLGRVDPDYAATVACSDRIRLVRGLEVYLLSGEPISRQFKQRAAPDLSSQYRIVKFGLCLPRAELCHRIDRRVERMFQNGLIEETRDALEQGYRPGGSGLSGIGYYQAVRFLQGETSLEQAVAEAKLRTRQYAKRQMTWFRKEARVIWLDTPGEEARTLEAALRILRVTNDE